MDKLNEEFPKKIYKELKVKGETNREEERFINDWKVSDLIYHAENNQDDEIYKNMYLMLLVLYSGV